MPKSGIATLTIKTINSNGLKWLCATVEFARGDNNKKGVHYEAFTVVSHSLSYHKV